MSQNGLNNNINVSNNDINVLNDTDIYSNYQDNGFEFYSYNMIKLDKYARKAAFNDITLFELFTDLDKIEITKTDYSLDNIPAATALTDVEKVDILSEISTSQNGLFENHFTLIYLILMAFIAIDAIFEKVPTIELLKFKRNIHNIATLYQESASNKDISFISQESTALRVINSLLYVISSFNSYYTSADFFKEAANVSVVKLDKDKVDIAKNYIIPSNRAKKVNVIKIEDIPEIDIKQPALTLSKIADSVKAVLSDSKTNIASIQATLSQKNILSAVFSSTESDRKMNVIRSRLDQLQDSMASGAIPEPIFSIVNVFKLYTFRGEPKRGRCIYSMQLMPGEKRELRQKTTEMTQEKRSKTSSIFDSLSQDTTDEFNNTLNTEAQTTNNSTKNVEDKINQKTELGAKFNVTAQAGIPKADYVKAGVDLSASQATTKDHATTVNNTRNQTNKIVNNAVQNHTKNVTSNRDVSLTENAESTTETTKENSSIITFANPNTASILNIDFHIVKDVYFCVVALSDIRVMFSNGDTYQEYGVEEIQSLLDEYVQPRLHDYLKNLTIGAGIVRDYADRDIRWIKVDENGNFSMDKHVFSTFCATNNYDIALPDLKTAATVIHGIPTSYFYTSLPAQGRIAAIGSVGQPLLDSNEQQLMNQRIKIEQARALYDTSKANLLQQKVDFNTKIFDEKIISMDNQDASQHYFLNFAEPSEYFNKTFILNMLNNIKKE